jgi:hypothetical protein
MAALLVPASSQIPPHPNPQLCNQPLNMPLENAINPALTAAQDFD